jgi:HlyD family secretion protein
MNKKKVILIVAGVVVVGGLIIATMMQDTTPGVDVYAEAVAKRELVEIVSASGRVQPKTRVDITSEINAEIIHLAVREGDRVNVGDRLVVLDTVLLRSDVDQARYSRNEMNARMEGTRTQLEQAEEEYERQKRLYESKLTSETAYKNARYAYLNAKTTYQAMEASARQAQARFEKQRDNFAKAKIVAPMAGIITFLDCEVGEIAAAQTVYSQGRKLMTISDLDVFEVEVDVDETEIAKVELGQETSIEVDAFPDTTFAGEVVEIGNTAIYEGVGTQDQSTNFLVKVVFKDTNTRVRPGMSATVDVTVAQKDDVLSIPFSSVVMRTYDLDSLERARAEQETGPGDSGGVQAAETDSAAEESEEEVEESGADEDKEPEELKGVFVIRDGTARFVQVETGIADQKHIEVISGVTDADTVLSGPYRLLRTIKDSDPVKVIPEEETETN